MVGVNLIASLLWYVKLVIAMIALFWLARDITKQGLGRKISLGLDHSSRSGLFFHEHNRSGDSDPRISHLE